MRSGIEKKKARWGWFFVLPAIAYFSIFSFYPIANAFHTSLYRWNLLSLNPPRFVWFENYLRLFQSEVFWNSVKATAIFTVGTFVSLLIGSLALSILIFSRKRFRSFFSDGVILSGGLIHRCRRDDLASDSGSPRVGQYVDERADGHERQGLSMVCESRYVPDLDDPYLFLEVYRAFYDFVHRRAFLHSEHHSGSGHDRWRRIMEKVLADHLSATQTNCRLGMCSLSHPMHEIFQHPVSLRAIGRA